MESQTRRQQETRTPLICISCCWRHGHRQRPTNGLAITLMRVFLSNLNCARWKWKVSAPLICLRLHFSCWFFYYYYYYLFFGFNFVYVACWFRFREFLVPFLLILIFYLLRSGHYSWLHHDRRVLDHEFPKKIAGPQPPMQLISNNNNNHHQANHKCVLVLYFLIK